MYFAKYKICNFLYSEKDKNDFVCHLDCYQRLMDAQKLGAYYFFFFCDLCG